MTENTGKWFDDLVFVLQRDIAVATFNRRKGDLGLAIIRMERALKAAQEQLDEIKQDILQDMSEREKSARLAAYNWAKSYMAPWDWNDSFDDDPLQIRLMAGEIVEQLTEEFGDAVPADIIRDLQGLLLKRRD